MPFTHYSSGGANHPRKIHYQYHRKTELDCAFWATNRPWDAQRQFLGLPSQFFMSQRDFKGPQSIGKTMKHSKCWEMRYCELPGSHKIWGNSIILLIRKTAVRCNTGKTTPKTAVRCNTGKTTPTLCSPYIKRMILLSRVYPLSPDPDNEARMQCLIARMLVLSL